MTALLVVGGLFSTWLLLGGVWDWATERAERRFMEGDWREEW